MVLIIVEGSATCKTIKGPKPDSAICAFAVLYQGGIDNVKRVVEGFYRRLYADERVRAVSSFTLNWSAGTHLSAGHISGGFHAVRALR